METADIINVKINVALSKIRLRVDWC